MADPDAETPKNPQNPGQPSYGNAGDIAPPSTLIGIDPKTLEGIMQGIAASNQRMEESWGNIEKSVSNYYQTLSKIPSSGVESVSGINRTRVPPPDDLYGSQQDLERLRSEEAQVVARSALRQSKVQARISDYTASAADEKIAELRRLNVIQKDREGESYAQVGEQRIPLEQVQEALSGPHPKDQKSSSILTALNQEVTKQYSKEVSKQAPTRVERILDTIEESGIRQLRFGQLQLQDILRSAGTIAGKATGDIQAGINYNAELGAWQARRAIAGPEFDEPEPEKPAGLLARYGGQIAARQAAGGGGLMGLPLTALAGAARVLPVAGQAIAVGQQLTRIAQGAYESAYQAPTRAGQLTGQGWRAGIAARIGQFRLGANPFDLFTGGQAAQTMEAVRGMGFTGTGRGGTMDVAFGIRDVVNDLGISVDQAASYFEDAMRRGGMSVDQVRETLSHFDDQAKALNMNINDYTAAILQNTQSIRSTGAGQAAPAIASALVSAVPRAYQGPGEEMLQGIFAANRGAITGELNRQGIGANIVTVTSQRYATQAYAAIDQLIARDVATARSQLGPNATENDLANWMAQAGVYTRGQDPAILQQYIQRMRRGQGLTQQLGIDRAARSYTRALHQLTGHQMTELHNLDTEQLKSRGITTRGGQPVITGDSHGGLVTRMHNAQYFDRLGNRLDSHRMMQLQAYSNDPKNVSQDRLEQIRREALAQLPPGTLSVEDRARFKAHLRDRSFSFAQELEKIHYEHRQQVGSRVDLPLVSIELKGNATKQFFELHTERSNAVNKGSVPSNSLPERIYKYTGLSNIF